MHKMENECPNGTYQIKFPSLPYVLEMRKEDKAGVIDESKRIS